MTTLAELYSALKYRIEVDEYGSRRYHNALGQLHRLDGPAIVFSSGSREWYLNGHLHRTDGPAVDYVDGTRMWYLNGHLHRTDGPAIEWPDGSVEWYLNGKKYTQQEYYTQLKTLGHTV